MKKWIFIVLAAVFVGCAKTETVWERVQDEACEPVTVSGNDFCEIFVYMPDDVWEATDGTGNARIYSDRNGDYLIKTNRFLADSADSAIRQVSAQNPDEITVLEATRFDLPEYRITWTDEGILGGSVCRAAMISDGMNWYSVLTAVREELSHDYENLILQVFSSFGLYQDQEI